MELEFLRVEKLFLVIFIDHSEYVLSVGLSMLLIGCCRLNSIIIIFLSTMVVTTRYSEKANEGARIMLISKSGKKRLCGPHRDFASKAFSPT